jgi:hypothetical protein
MGRVEGQRQVHPPAAGLDIRGKALVVFHVTAAQAAGITTFELLEKIRRRFAEDVHQHVQAPAVRHADHDLPDTLPAGAVDQLADQRYQALAPFQ